ncbi:hypothetical protein HRbin30_03342 [bacterium HR30]|nr:hypothetical protein HRbin30_03342 [bacterium HR30]
MLVRVGRKARRKTPAGEHEHALGRFADGDVCAPREHSPVASLTRCPRKHGRRTPYRRAEARRS